VLTVLQEELSAVRCGLSRLARAPADVHAINGLGWDDLGLSFMSIIHAVSVQDDAADLAAPPAHGAHTRCPSRRL
jgi:hypothetical protein